MKTDLLELSILIFGGLLALSSYGTSFKSFDIDFLEQSCQERESTFSLCNLLMKTTCYLASVIDKIFMNFVPTLQITKVLLLLTYVHIYLYVRLAL